MSKLHRSQSSIDKLKLLCRRNLYETVVCDVNHDKNAAWTFLMNGPCGVLLRHNIVREWWHSNVTLSEEAVFGIGRSIDAETSMKIDTNRRSNRFSSLAKQISFKYPLISKAVDGKLPLGLAQCETSDYEAKEYNYSEDVPIRFDRRRTNLTLQFYVPPPSSREHFNKLQRQRLRWWKKFSRQPSSFQMSTIRSEDDTQTVDICYKFPWGEGTIETINSYGHLSLQEEFYKGKDDGKTVVPWLIECNSSVEDGLLSFLVDSFREKKINDESSRIVLCLHNRLAPFKVVVARSTDLESNDQLKDLSSFIVSDLRNRDVSIFDWSNTKSDLNLEQQFQKYDEMGIPYCIVMDVTALKNGIVGLRSRDTTIQEQIHISEINEKLLKYVQSY